MFTDPTHGVRVLLRNKEEPVAIQDIDYIGLKNILYWRFRSTWIWHVLPHPDPALTKNKSRENYTIFEPAPTFVSS